MHHFKFKFLQCSIIPNHEQCLIKIYNLCFINYEAKIVYFNSTLFMVWNDLTLQKFKFEKTASNCMVANKYLGEGVYS